MYALSVCPDFSLFSDFQGKYTGFHVIRVECHSYWWYIWLMTNADLEDLCYEEI